MGSQDAGDAVHKQDNTQRYRNQQRPYRAEDAPGQPLGVAGFFDLLLHHRIILQCRVLEDAQIRGIQVPVRLGGMADEQQAVTGTPQFEPGAPDAEADITLVVAELYVGIAQGDLPGGFAVFE